MTRVLITLEDYAQNENLSPEERQYNLIATVVAVFAALWVLELCAFSIYSSLSGPVFGPKKHRVVLSRHSMDILSMIAFSYMGFEALEQFGGWQAIPNFLLANGKVAAIGAERAYFFSSAAQRLCIWQIAYEAKNFYDSVIHNDGAVFLAHHFVTALLSALATRPFLHIYCAYFLGISEVSTTILCGLVLFDKQRGVPPLAEAAPVLMKVTGVAFAVAFIIFRIIIWPVLCYFFWIDMLQMINDGSVHSFPQACIFLTVNVGLSVLQVVWLGEIISTAIKLFGDGGDLTIQRGGADKVDDKLVGKDSKKVR